jgi:hypothetical protein
LAAGDRSPPAVPSYHSAIAPEGNRITASLDPVVASIGVASIGVASIGVASIGVASNRG